MFSVPNELERIAAEIDGWLELRCPQRAIERLSPLLDHPKARPAGLAFRVRALVATKRHAEALEDISEMREFDLDPSWLDLTEAWCLKRMDDLPGSIRCMDQLLNREPRSAIGHFNKGCYQALSGDLEAALDSVTVACGLDENFRELLMDEVDLKDLHRDPRFLELCKPS